MLRSYQKERDQVEEELASHRAVVAQAEKIRQPVPGERRRAAEDPRVLGQVLSQLQYILRDVRGTTAVAERRPDSARSIARGEPRVEEARDHVGAADAALRESVVPTEEVFPADRAEVADVSPEIRRFCGDVPRRPGPAREVSRGEECVDPRVEPVEVVHQEVVVVARVKEKRDKVIEVLRQGGRVPFLSLNSSCP